MANFARVVDGVVAEPMVSLPDGDQPSKYFPAALPGEWIECQPNVMSGWLYTPPATFVAPPVVINPALAVQGALGAGCAVTSTTTPALSGTYGCDPVSQSRIAAEALYVQVTTGQGAAKFTNGAATKGWPDSAGGMHTFGLTDFINFAEAVAQYVDAVVAWGAAGATSSAPAQPVTIA